MSRNVDNEANKQMRGNQHDDESAKSKKRK